MISKIRKFFAEEIAKLRKMSFADKRWYIWEYYKIHIFLTIFALFVTGYLIHRAVFPPPRDYVYIAWQAGPIHPLLLDELSESLHPIVPDMERYVVAVRSYVISGADPQHDQALITRFHALLTVGDLHVTLLPYEDLTPNAEFGTIKAIDDLFPELSPAMYENARARAVTVDFIDRDGEEVSQMVAIHLAGAPLLEELGIDTTNLYLALISTGNVYSAVANVLEMMFEGGVLGE